MKTRICLLASVLCLLTSAGSAALHAQDIRVTADQLTAKLKEAKKPKSDKWNFSLLPIGMQKNPQIDYTMMGEVTTEGKKLPTPSVNNPVYYYPHAVGQHDMGDAYGGTKEIPYKSLEKQLLAALASNGYLPSDEQHPPTQLLLFTWGMHNRIDPMPDPDSDDGSDDSGDGSDASATDTSSMGGDMNVTADDNDIMNLLSRAKTIGGQKFADEFATALSDQLQWSGNTDYESNGPLRRFATRDDNTEALVYEIFNDCYFIIVTALDYEALKSNQRKTLWITRISTTSQGVNFEQTLPIMINNGAWFFGRETSTPEIVRKKAYKDARVDIGEATVVEYMTTGTTTTTGTTKPSTTTTGTTK